MEKKPNSFAAGPSLATIRATMSRMWIVAAVGKGGAQVIQLVAMMILARILVPDDFGVVVIAMVFIGFADIFRDFGLSAATVRAPELQPQDASAMFALNVFLGFAMAIVAVLLAPFVSAFFGEPKVALAVQCLAATFIVNGLGAQHQALLRRELKFGVLAKINIFVVAVSQGVAVALAVYGLGYWSLVVALIVASLARTIALWYVSSWRPGSPVFTVRTKRMLGFGLYLSLFGLMGFLANQTHNIVIAGKYGPADVGYYSRATLILDMALSYILAPLATVVPATLSKVLNDAKEYKTLYFEFLAMMLCVSVPIGFLVFVLAGDIVSVVLGDAWLSSILILQILALSVIPRTISASSGWLYQSHGDSRRMLLWGVFGWSGVFIALIVGARYGIAGVAIAYSAVMFLLLYPCMKFAFKNTVIQFADLFPVAAPFAVSGCLALIPAYLLSLGLEGYSSFLRLPVLSLIYSTTYILILIYGFHEKKTLYSLMAKALPNTKSEPKARAL